MKKYIVTFALLASFLFGCYVNGLRWETKFDDYRLQASQNYVEALKQEVAKKDATINLLLSQGQRLKADSSSLAHTVGRLQQSIRVSNSKLESESTDSNRKIVDCQKLLSESTRLLKEGVDLSTDLAIKIN